MTPDDIAEAVSRALEARDTTAFRAARDAGLPDNAIRYLLEGRDSRISRLVQICDALGLEFYIGRPRVISANVSMVRESPPGYGAHKRTSVSPGDTTRSRDSNDTEHDWFTRTIEPLRKQYRALDTHGRAAMLTRVVAAFLNIETPPTAGGKRDR